MMNTRLLARKALKEQIAMTAFNLFKENGYEKTTVEAISVAVGMSTRTFFRYFPTKEDVLLDPTYLFKSRFLESFEQRLATEDIWDALKNLLIELALNCTGTGEGERQKLIRSTPAVFARQLEIFEGLLSDATDLYLSQHQPDEDFSWPVVNALLRSGFSCLQAVQGRLPDKASDEAFTALMAQMRPVILTKIQ